MPEETRRALDELGRNANKLTTQMIERLSDIAYGMSLVKESRESKEPRCTEKEKLK